MAPLDPPTRAFAVSWLRQGRSVPLARRVDLSAEPASLCERLLDGAYPFLLESARRHPITGRWSFLGCDPTQVIRASADDPQPLEDLRTLLAHAPMVTVEGLPPFVGGAVGVFGYDLGHRFERLPRQATDDLHLPDLCVGLYDTIVAMDHVEPAVWLVTRMAPDGDPDRAYDAAAARLDALEGRLTKSTGDGLLRGQSPTTHVSPPEVIAEMSQPAFERMVREAQRWIADGEIYQANLSQRLRVPLTDSPWGLYRRLRAVNPSPFAAYFDAGDVQLVSASPERLVRRAGDVVETRPIAGTRPRTGDPADDRRLLDELIAHPKERAEHLMLVDLERSDLGRVCDYGSVAVTDLMTLEQYSHVSHIVSNIRGRVSPGRDWLDVLAAVFPGGTITGCPKVRAIECIDALEPVRRQWYTGSIGYISFTGAMDLNLIIRSAVVHRGQVYVQVGAGIVADSDPAREYDETLQKAQALLVALGQGVEADAVAVA